MKKVSLCLMILAPIVGFGQSPNTRIKELWDIIQKQEVNAEVKSMLPNIKEVLTLSKKNKDYPSMMKAMFYEAKVNIIIQEDEKYDINTIIDQFKKESNTVTGATRAILDTYIAEIYKIYYDANRYKIQSRTAVENGGSKSIEFWTSEDFKREMDKHYMRALTLAKSDRDAVIGSWADVFNTAGTDLGIKWSKFTVYDALRLNQIENIRFNSFDLSDEQSKLYSERSEQLKNELLDDLKTKGDTPMYVYVQMYLSVYSTDQELIKKTFISLLEQYPDEPLVYSGYANHLHGVELVALIDKAVKKFPNTKLTADLLTLKKNAEAVRFNYSINKYVLGDQAIPVSIGHQNADKVYVKILKNTDTKKNVEGYYRTGLDEYQQLVKNYTTVDTYELMLGEFKDYEMHRTIASLKPLKGGRYFIVTSSVPFTKIVKEESDVQINLVNVTSNIIEVNNGKLRAYDRKTGKPLSNTKILIANEDEKRDYNSYWETVITTDANGQATIDISKLGRYLYMNVKGEDVYYSTYTYNYNNEEDTTEEGTTYKATILTDRGIYRPAQVMYFKSIIGKKTPTSEQVVEKTKVTVLLTDANGTEVSKQELTTNEFGSVNGQFVLPSSGKLGYYGLQVDLNDKAIGWSSVRMEEYKRPKFEVAFEELKGIYKLNEEVVVTGNAKAFLGANIDKAKVVYRVVRQEIWPRWICGTSFPYRRDKGETMIQGETVTDALGKFTVSFKALSKGEATSTLPRTFIYTVFADVTDQNGETHSQNHSVIVGEKNIELSVNLPVITTAKDLSNFTISTRNLNGIDYASQGELTIYPLLAPNPSRITDDFGLTKGDYQLYNYDEFVALFPNLVYGDESDSSKWKEGVSVFNTSFDTAKGNTIVYNGAKQLSSGNYIVKGYVLENGVKNEIEKTFILRNEEIKEASKKLVELKAEQRTYKVGDKATVEVRSAEDNTYAFVEVMANGKTVSQKVMKISKKGTKVDIPIKLEYKKVNVYALALKHNMAVQDAAEIALKEDADKLQIVIESFRDKVEPGAKEKWSLKVKGEEKEQVVAELLATMYDASLDEFVYHNLNIGLKEPVYYNNQPSFTKYNFQSLRSTGYFSNLVSKNVVETRLGIDRPVFLNTYGFSIYNASRYKKSRLMAGSIETSRVMSSSIERDTSYESDSALADVVMTGVPSALQGQAAGVSVLEENAITETKPIDGSSENKETTPAPTVRKNLQETTFFYPTLKTDENGDVKFEFTMPEALTKWKFMAFGHTKNLRQAYTEQTVITQKELMVVPNLPRFLRQGDKLTLSTKVINLSDTTRKGKATLQLFNAYTNELILEKSGEFSANKSESTAVNWDIEVPNGVDVVTCRVVAVSDNFSDGEESALPVLSNRILVTETMPIFVKEGQNKLFSFKAYEKEISNTLQNHKLTLELTANPIWNAVFAIPYLQEYPYDCSEQLFSKVFANAVATKIMNDNPKIKTVFDQWNAKGQVTSKLEQNQELKSILLAETPWVREAVSEEEQMKRIAILFDLNKMRMDLQTALEKLAEQQNSDGGFTWFKGGKSDLYITQTIVEGFGNLKKIGVLEEAWINELGYKTLLSEAIKYIDATQYTDYLNRDKKVNPNEVTSINTHYLYARSFFIGEYGINEKYAPMVASIRKGIESEKPSGNLYKDAMRAVVAKRFGLVKTADTIIKNIMETAVSSDEMGMYWKNNVSGWLWYQAPIETQVAIIEAANEVDKDKYANDIEQMKVWLLKNKQTTGWSSTKATTKAVYALMYTGKSWVDAEKGLEVKVGGYPVDMTKDAQLGSGYIKQTWSKAEMTAKKGIVEITKTSPGVAYGAMYWQYFEDIDAVNSANTSIKMAKKLYIKSNIDKGQTLREITKDTPIKVGDLVTVRLEISVDRDMDYIHLKDMRASGFEPTNVLSGYRWKGEFGYYEETRDASTNFFINRLRKGNYVFEYELRANVGGNFSNGITTMQNMYAPEMSAHSEGARVDIKN